MRAPNLVTFKDKARYTWLHDHRPLMVPFADEATTHEHVAGLVLVRVDVGWRTSLN